MTAPRYLDDWAARRKYERRLRQQAATALAQMQNPYADLYPNGLAGGEAQTPSMGILHSLIGRMWP